MMLRHLASFSLTMSLLLFVWLPRDSPAAIYAATDRLCRATGQTRGRLISLATVGAVGVGVAYAARAGSFPRAALNFGLGLWLCQTAVMLACLWAARGGVQEPTPALLRPRFSVLWAAVALLAFNVLCPYIGLKTRTTLNMHSNLRTEGDTWNHLFLPQAMQVFDYQDDLVEIVASDLPDFDYLHERSMPLPYFEFRRWCRLAPDDFFVEYRRRGGSLLKFEKKAGHGSDPELMTAYPVAEWFLAFNPVGSTHDYMPALVQRLGPARNVVPKLSIPKPE